MAFSVSFSFKASDRYTKVLNAMARATKKQADALKKLESAARQSKNIFKVLSASVSSAGSKVTQASGKLRRYTSALNQATSATKRLVAASKSVSAVNPRIPSNKNLGGHRFTNTGVRSSRVRGLAGEAATSLGVIGGTLLAPIVASVNAARSIESEFSNLRKVFDGTNAQLETTKKNIIAMSRVMPMSIEGITQIATAASEAGIRFKDLAQFTDIAVKSSVAFDMSSELVGDALVKTRTQFGLSMPSLKDYTDQVNYLSNNMASKAKEVLTVVMEIGNSAKTLGLTAGQTAAFASTLVDTGTKALRADGALKDLFITLSAVKTTMPKRSKMSLIELMGVSVNTFDKAIKNNPLETMLVMFEKAKARGKAGGDLLASIFGKQYISEIQGLTNNLGKLKQALKDIGDRQKFVGSVQKEYDIRLKTFNNSWEIFKNNIRVLGNVIGKNLLPVLTSLFNKISPVIARFSEWADKNPKAVTTLTLVASALGAVATALAGLAGLVWLFTPLVELAGTLIMTDGALTGFGAALVSLGSGPLGGVAVALAAVTAAVVYCWNNFKGFRDLVVSLGGVAMMAASMIKDHLVSEFQKLKDMISGCLAVLNSFIGLLTGGNWNLDKLGAALSVNFDRAAEGAAIGINQGVNSYNQNRVTAQKSLSLVKIDLNDPGKMVNSVGVKNPYGGFTSVDFLGTGKQMKTGKAY